jgi:enoyl-CoA hydratase
MEYEFIKTEREDSTFIVTLNRPDKLNALSPQLTGEVVQALQEIQTDEGIRAVIITGGPKVFAAGADLSKMQTATPVDMYSRNLAADMWTTVAKMPMPTIAAVAGYALGGGCELAMACDLRIAADNAKFGQPEINVGIYPGAGGTQRLSRLIGLGRAKELVFLGGQIDAEEAYRVGLVNKVVPADSLLDEAKAWAKKLATKPPFTLKIVKAVMDEGYDLSLESALRLERMGFIGLFGTEDQREGVTAFLEKRKPEFKGR